MWLSGFATNGSTFKHVQQLIALRRELAPLRRGDVTFRYATANNGEESDAGLLAFERAYQGERVLVLLNNKDRTLGHDGVPTGFAPGTTLTDRLSGDRVVVGADGAIRAELAPRGARILVAR